MLGHGREETIRDAKRGQECDVEPRVEPTVCERRQLGDNAKQAEKKREGGRGGDLLLVSVRLYAPRRSKRCDPFGERK
jgi:hypothetical protein